MAAHVGDGAVGRVVRVAHTRKSKPIADLAAHRKRTHRNGYGEVDHGRSFALQLADKSGAIILRHL